MSLLETSFINNLKPFLGGFYEFTIGKLSSGFRDFMRSDGYFIFLGIDKTHPPLPLRWKVGSVFASRTHKLAGEAKGRTTFAFQSARGEMR
jgi:hypothetical protein